MSDLEQAAADVMAGDVSAFPRIVHATQDDLIRLSARILGRVADAEDVVQESYVRAYRSLVGRSFDRRCAVKTWLYRIVVNASIDAKRTRKRAPVLAADERSATEWGGAASAETRVALAELADWLGSLPADQQVAMILKAVEGRSSAEIAEIQQCSEGAVEQRLVRARAALHKRGSDHDGSR